MLVSHSKKFIFTKTAKTASTSVEAFFEPYCVEPGNHEFRLIRESSESAHGIVGYRGPPKPFMHWPFIGIKWRDHLPAWKIRRRVGRKTWNSYFKFCVVRNPFEKVISGFHYFQKINTFGNWNTINQLPTLKLRFKKWVETEIASRNILFDRNRYVIDGKLSVDYVIRFESLLQGIEIVCNELGVKGPEDFPHLLGGYRPAGRNHAEYYDEETRKIVEDIFEFELENFGYQFDNG